MPSSSAKCSAANVGPNLSSSEPEYFFLIKFNTRRRSFDGLLRFEGRPAFPFVLPADSQLQHHSCIAQLQVPTTYSPHDFRSLQLTTAHGRPLQQDLLWLEVSV